MIYLSFQAISLGIKGDISSFPYTFIAADERGINYPERFSIVVDIDTKMFSSIDPLTFFLHQLVTLRI